LEREKIEAEYLELIKKIEYYRAILESEKRLLGLIKEELEELKKKFADPRRSEILGELEEIDVEDLIAEEDVVITISHTGYIKRLPVSAYRRQKRGGKGVTGMETKEEDFVEYLFIASTHEYILFFTDKGKLYWLKVYDIPQAGRQAKGKAIINLLELATGEKISAFVPVKEFKEDKYLIMCTAQGVIKKTDLMAFANPRKGGIIACSLDDGDELISVKMSEGNSEMILATREGKAIRFKEQDVREMGRSAKGVRAIRLAKKDVVIGMEIVNPAASVLSVTELGFGKRTSFDEYRLQSRGGKGIINVKITDKNGAVVGLHSVTDKDEIMIITSGGMLVRCRVKEIREVGRSTQGVRLIKMSGKDKVSAVAKVEPEEEAEVEEAIAAKAESLEKEESPKEEAKKAEAESSRVKKAVSKLAEKEIKHQKKEAKKKRKV
jgi:DNA gyrase subunit A